MTKPDWKKKFYEPHLTAAQKVKVLEEQVMLAAEQRDKADEAARYYKRERDEARLDAARYNALRQKEVMVFDGEPKYLVGEALDEYCDTIKDDFYGMSISEMINQMGNHKRSAFTATPTKLMVPLRFQQQAEQILKEHDDVLDARIQSEKANQENTGDDKHIFRNADRYRLR